MMASIDLPMMSMQGMPEKREKALLAWTILNGVSAFNISLYKKYLKNRARYEISYQKRFSNRELSNIYLLRSAAQSSGLHQSHTS